MSREHDKTPRPATYTHGEAAARRVNTVLADCVSWGCVAEVNHVHGSIVSVDYVGTTRYGVSSVTNLTLDMLAWRLCDVTGKTVVASGFPSKQIQPKLQVLVGAFLTNSAASETNPVDLTLQFSTGHCLLTFDQCETFPDDFEMGDDLAASLPDAYCAWWIAPTRDEYLCCCPGGHVYIETYL